MSCVRTISNTLDLHCKGKRVNIISVANQNCAGEIVDVFPDGLELKADASLCERVFVTNFGLVIKVLK